MYSLGAAAVGGLVLFPGCLVVAVGLLSQVMVVIVVVSVLHVLGAVLRWHLTKQILHDL